MNSSNKKLCGFGKNIVLGYKLHSKSAPIEIGEPILWDWVTPTGLIKKPKPKKSKIGFFYDCSGKQQLERSE